LSGLAKVFMRRLNDEYVAGLWKRDLHRSLLWLIASEINEPLTYRAPTWSWASVDASISYPGWGDSVWNPIAQILEAIMFPVTEDITGRLTGGYLRIAGPLQKIFWQDPLNMAPSTSFTRNLIVGWLVIQSLLEKVSSTSIFISTSMGDNTEDSKLSIEFSVADIRRGQEMFLVPLICSPIHEEDKRITRGLVLCPEENITGTYRRIGTFEVLRSSIYRRIFFSDSTLEDIYYERLDELKRYIIQVI
jgi:hypothetical protein